ncbi:MBL fold metallo-hydrolase [Virgibacillus ndiopensis]|uniref:MBL fold metallo-hydrolase n=1 Tax=Virgibacillus ndiopensis TaxID=2004408 RepID=UPI000C06FDE8|nr:MBL fold metallo-hydrolase [Virgibacillus ndiopensis]
MDTYFQEITENLYGFLLWDKSWESYNNCYILIEDNEVTLIDSGKEEHFEHLEAAMKSIGIDKRNVSKFIATHGHRDHIGGFSSLEDIEGYIHKKDLELLPEKIRNKINPNLPDSGFTINNLECVHLGHHTNGSVLLYHSGSNALFRGDHICFFGEPLISNNVVERYELYIEESKKFVSDWSHSEEMRSQHNFDMFIEGLNAINKFNIEYLCTGHSVVLKGNINEFIADLLELE